MTTTIQKLRLKLKAERERADHAEANALQEARIAGDLNMKLITRAQEYDKKLAAIASTPIEMLLFCPACGHRHVDKGQWATKPHHTHACQYCGHVWRPAVSNTVGVQFLPGFKDT